MTECGLTRASAPRLVGTSSQHSSRLPLLQCRYGACDVGTLPNQTYPNGTAPIAAKNSGSTDYGGELSYVSTPSLHLSTVS